jgi:ABC-type transport system substrate-binding protein
MRKWSKQLIFSLFVISMLFPVFSISVKAQGTVPTFTVGACGPTPVANANWDGVCFGSSSADYFRYNALEGLFDYPYGAESGDFSNLVPILATNWTIHNRPDGMNAAGFMNYAGVDYMDITLRNNVKFQDGSDWNTTVCKWNIDRLMVILGNINGSLGSPINSAVTNNRGLYWLSIKDWSPYATASWNVANLHGPLAPAPYNAYGYLSTYPGFGNSSQYDIPYAYNRFPRFTNVTILDNKQSGGTLRVYFNDWGSGPQYLASVYMKFISMKAYKNYFTTPIFGYGTNPSRTDLVGTGPYKFDYFSIDTGTMTKFDNWWNASAQQAKGWDMVPKVAIAEFDHSISGYDARTTALVTGDIDFAYDHSWEPLGYSDVIQASNLKYVQMGQENYGETLTLNCANETYLRYWYDIGLNLTQYSILIGLPTSHQYKNPDGTLKSVSGVDRAFRKALTYAFDYNTYLSLFNGRVVRSGGLLSATNEYYDPSVPLPNTDLTVARQTLLNDPFWGSICTAHGLSGTSTTTAWNAVATSSPLFTFYLHYDDAHLQSYQMMISALANIGCAINATKDSITTYTSILGDEFSLLSNHGFAIKAPQDRINDLGFIQAYYQSTGVVDRTPSGTSIVNPYLPALPAYPRFIADYSATKAFPYAFPYKGSSNMGFSYNETADNYIAKIWFQNDTGRALYYSKLADWAQNYQYPVLYLGTDLTGRAMNKDWTTGWSWNINVLHFDLVKYSPTAPAIPGFSVGFLLCASLIGLIGIAFNIINKKKK